MKVEAIFPKTALKTALKIAISVFFRGLKSKSGYFLGFSKKISNEHTCHFFIKSPPPGICPFINTRLLVPLLELTSCKVLAFVVLRHKSINFLSIELIVTGFPNDGKLSMQLHVFDSPTGSSGFCFETSANKSFVSFKLSQTPSKRLKSIQVCNS